MKFSVAAVFVLLTIGGCRMVTPPSSETRDTNQASVEAASDETPSFMRGDKHYQQLAREELAKTDPRIVEKIREMTNDVMRERRAAFETDRQGFLNELVEMSRTIFYPDRYKQFVDSLNKKDPNTALRSIAEHAIRYAIMREIIQEKSELVKDVFNKAFDRANGGAPVPMEQFFRPTPTLKVSLAVMVVGYAAMAALPYNPRGSFALDVAVGAFGAGMYASMGAALYAASVAPALEIMHEREFERAKACQEQGGYWRNGRCFPTEAGLELCKSKGGVWMDDACIVR